MTRQRLTIIIITLVAGAVLSLAGHSKMVSDEEFRVAVFSAENLRGTMKWWLWGAPFYLFVIFAPDKYFLDEGDEDSKN